MSIRTCFVACGAVVAAFAGALVPASAVTANAPPAHSPWSVFATPQPSVRQASLAAVACPRVRTCIAVGGATDRHGSGVALSELWDGTSWSVVRLQTPPGARSAVAMGIACAGPMFCMAVGHSTLGTLAELWNGAGWSIVPTPDAPGGGPSVLRGVACANSSMCMAVGDHDPTHGLIHPLIERWDGAAWSIQTPGPGAGPLSAVACPAVDSCMAVGRSLGRALAESWDGSTWQATDARTRAALSGVACPAPTACVAVGSHGFLGFKLPVVERWDGSNWSVVPVDWPLNIVLARLNGIACASADACAAVGFAARDDHGSEGTLVVAWDGSTWSVPETPSAPHASVSELQDVACPSPSRCSAVGTAQTKRKSQQLFKALALTWDGTAWSLTTPINPPGAESAGLTGVSCTSATFCMAIGNQWSYGLPGDAPGVSQAPGGPGDVEEKTSRFAFAARWNGRRWSLVPMHAPPGSLAPLMFAVSCTSPEFCMAVGEGGTRREQAAAAQVWDGHAWSSVAPPSPRPGGELLGVSCSSSSRCIAVGDDGVFPQDLFPLAVRWDGQMWREMKTPRPARFSSLESVSCSTIRWCMAVGSSQSSINAPYKPLTERWDGRRWAVETARWPHGAGGAILEGVSCAGVDQCMAVGSTSPHSNHAGALAEAWNGGSWRVTDTPTGRSDALYGVACASVDRCVAVGTRTNGTLAEIWSNHAWSVSRTPNPSRDAWFIAVSCVGADDCTAVGLWFDGSFANTLAERYRA